MEYKERMKKEQEYRDKLFASSPNVILTDDSGIYIFTREDEIGLRHAYVGQAKHILSRCVEHCMGFEQHIDRSIEKHGFYSDENANGWRVAYTNYMEENELDKWERYWIVRVGNKGYQLLNKTGGGQDSGKVGITENAPARGYRDGLKQGYKNAKRDVAKLFEKNLRAEINGEPNKLKQRAMEKFLEFIKN